LLNFSNNMSAELPLIAVVGATGSQGGSVARFLKNSGKYRVRGLTRNTDSDAAQKLQAEGIELVVADLTNKESLVNAFSGCYGVFGVTNYWEAPDKPEIELQQGHNIADAAKQAGIKHVVFSSLEDCEKLSGGKYKVAHFDGKARIAEYMKSIGLSVTEVRLAFYMDNFQTNMHPKDENGTWVFSLPMGNKRMAMVAVQDIGGIVLYTFDHPNESIGKVYGVAGDALTGEEIAQQFTQVTGKPAIYRDIPVEVFKKFPFPGAAELGNMFQFYQDSATKVNDVPHCKQIYPQLKSFKDWLQQTGFLSGSAPTRIGK